MKKIYRQNSNLVTDQSGASLGFFIENLISSKFNDLIYFILHNTCPLGF